MRILNRVTGIEGVAPSSPVTVNFPINRRYHGVKFFVTLAGVPAAVTDVIDRVRLLVNGVTIRDLTAAQIIAISTFNGIVPALGELPVNFSEPWRADKIDEQVTAWDMFGERTFKAELVLKAYVGVATISAVSSFDGGQTLASDGKTVLKNIVRQVSVGNNAGSGLYDIDNLPIRDPIQRIHLFGTQSIDSVEVTADNVKVQEVTKEQNARFLADYGLNASAVANYFPIAFDFTEQITDALVVNKTLNVRINSAGAHTVQSVVESRAPGYV